MGSRSMNWPAMAALVASVVLTAAPVGPQAPARDNASKNGAGVIRGRVIAADTGAPLRRARVTLSQTESPRQRVAETDLAGRYEFTDLPAGRYRVGASKGLYVPLEFGQRRAFEAGRTLELADGATLEKVDLALPRGGVISGHVVDDLGEPVAWARVSAMRSRFREGRRRLEAVGRSVVTNDLGEFRLYGLPPGTYAVGTIPEPTATSDGYPFAPAYYPGTQRVEEARTITLGLGQERGGIDFVQPPGRLVQVSGTVIDSRGRPLTGATASLVNVAIGSVMSSPVNPDGTFTIANVAPGEYGLAASVIDPATGARDMSMIPLTVASDDVTGFVAPIVPGSRVAGRVVTGSGGVPPFSPAGLRVGLTLLPSGLPSRLPAGAIGGMPGAVGADWTFELKGVAGTVLFSIGKLPEGWMLRSVLLDGRDITDTPLDVHGTEEVTGLEVAVTNRTTEIGGTVSDAKGDPVQDYTIVVFAEDAARWRWPSRFVRTARPDQSGNFKIANLPAAKYLVVALDYVEEGESDDPEFLELLRSRGTTFTLAEGETRALQLKLFRLEDPTR